MINRFTKLAKNTLRPIKQWFEYARLPSGVTTSILQTHGEYILTITADDPGSLGDAAMLKAIVSQYGPNSVDVTVWNHQHPSSHPNIRQGVRIDKLKGKHAEKTLRAYGSVRCMGADVMDGLYSYPASCLRLRLLNLAAHMGLESRLLGFSFNAAPHPRAVSEFKALHRDIVVCARDSLSFERLSAIADLNLRLVADMAFLVRPTLAGNAVRAAADWVALQKAGGRQVIGLNVHPLFSFEHGAAITQALVASLAALIRSQGDYAFVLIPHDFRSTFGDCQMLDAVASAVADKHADRILVLRNVDDPAELKGFVGHLDGVLTGRMHLAIAALGQQVPVSGITYQGKFEGLLHHFELDSGSTISPNDAADPDQLILFFQRWVKTLNPMRIAIARRLPQVEELARLNFA